MPAIMDSYEEKLFSKQICIQSEDSSTPIHAPVTINPTPFSATAFERAITIHPLFNLLVLRTVQNAPLLKEVCSTLAQSDDFVSKLFQIYLKYPAVPKVTQTF